jgi:hypothetical protein
MRGSTRAVTENDLKEEYQSTKRYSGNLALRKPISNRAICSGSRARLTGESL